MSDTLIRDAQAFLAQLSRNNTRDWFQTNKADYDSKLRNPAKALLDDMTPRLGRLTGYDVTAKLFRANRDVRFSKDKTPYTTHLHMMWTVQSGARQDPALFFGIQTQGAFVATGMPEFSKEVLADWRKMVDLDGAYVQAKVDDTLASGFSFWDPKLKRVPPPFDRDHDHGDMLRHKGLVATGPVDPTPPLADTLETAFKSLWPLSDMLIGIAEAPQL